ncbi:hypothetical protein PR048_028302 [Dryococelus australis]|uniref:Uncharacterized protein n=1 Tax=Dryococelus australis TaxID=614101 RepID=A0ABQ9GIX9_9NEOP|nr:hypothetical protein PR048_028302 [Dryococelus australis]
MRKHLDMSYNIWWSEGFMLQLKEGKKYLKAANVSKMWEFNPVKLLLLYSGPFVVTRKKRNNWY